MSLVPTQTHVQLSDAPLNTAPRPETRHEGISKRLYLGTVEDGPCRMNAKGSVGKESRQMSHGFSFRPLVDVRVFHA